MTFIEFDDQFHILFYDLLLARFSLNPTLLFKYYKISRDPSKMEITDMQNGMNNPSTIKSYISVINPPDLNSTVFLKFAKINTNAKWLIILTDATRDIAKTILMTMWTNYKILDVLIAFLEITSTNIG